jgi:hypothetical protein
VGYRDAVGLYEKFYGADSPPVATALTHLALLAEDRGQFEVGEGLAQRALAIAEKTTGATGIEASRARNQLTLMAIRLGRGAQAVELAQQVLAERAPLGPAHPELFEARGNLGLAQLANGEAGAGLSTLTQALADAEQAKVDRQVVEWLRLKKGAALVKSRPRDALELLTGASAYYEHRAGREAWSLGTSLLAASRARERLGERAGALELAVRARQTWAGLGDSVGADVKEAEQWISTLRRGDIDPP